MSSPGVDRLSPAQFKAALWMDAALRPHALLLGERVAELAPTLAAAELDDYDCLWPGALDARQRAAAPYLVRLARDSAFTDWVVGRARDDAPEWGLLGLSAMPFLALRNALRALCRARLADGRQIDLAWMDPVILGGLLPGLDAIQAAAFFGPLPQIVLPDATGWTWWRDHGVQRQARHVDIAG